MTPLYEAQNDALRDESASFLPSSRNGVRLTGVRRRQHGVGAWQVGAEWKQLERSELPERTRNMRKLMAVSLFVLLAAGSAFAHAGHIHTYMGTVSMLHGGGGFMIK